MSTAVSPATKPHRALAWWQGWHEDRATMARLRRCQTAHETFMVPACHDLLRRHGLHGGDLTEAQARQAGRIGIAAIVLAHIRQHAPGERVARQIGSHGKKEPSDVSEARFRRLLRTETNEELLRAMVRLVKKISGRTNVADLSDSIVFWGDRVRQRWAFDYFDAADAAPVPRDTSPTTDTVTP
ncbi:MAG: type I-E CRISPR-associated protein Cse2/CasB [Alphaproteobacteria bacterium]|nr:type I-E CRISPR-associated protein Cse2/CasB [Alphaproteobacteria bacterium]